MSNCEFCHSAAVISGGILAEHTCVRLRDAESRNAQSLNVRLAEETAFLKAGKVSSRVKFMMRWTTAELKACKVMTVPRRNP